MALMLQSDEESFDKKKPFYKFMKNFERSADDGPGVDKGLFTLFL
jgi:hypothetical protein